MRSSRRRSLAFTVACAVALTLAVPFGGLAVADTNNTLVSLDVEVETATNTVGTTHTLTAIVHNRDAGAEIDFEIDCISNCASAIYTRVGTTGAPAAAQNGGPVNAFDSGVEGDQTSPAVDDTRSTPELSCTTTSDFGGGGRAGCQVVYSRSNTGEELIAGWVDDNRANEENDSDTTEGRDEAVAPGTISETGGGDDTDVVSKTWFTATATNVRLDCDDDDTTDTETNAPGVAERYTCFAVDTKGTTSVADDSGVSGQQIDAENLGGANDPDNGFTSTTADFAACTTGSDGRCTFDLVTSDNETGTANVCFWIDEDNDNGFDINGGEFDGGQCDAPGEWAGTFNASAPTGDEYPAVTLPANRTDAVQKTWTAPTATTLDALPERDANVKGTSHSITATVTDQFGNPIANAGVDFRLMAGSANTARLICDQVLSNSSGVATCSYTDATTVVGPEPEIDTILACVDADDNDACDADDAAVDEATAAEFTNLGDRIEKFWFTTLPTAATVLVDMDAGANPNSCDDDDPTTDPNEVETNHDVCGIALNASGAALAGVNVTLTLSGPGFFTSERGTASRADDPNLGTSITVTTDANGIWRATITSLRSGTTTLTATSGSASDTGTKTWTALAAGARTLDCAPETATNPSGTRHVITCTALDRLGNPVAGEGITVTETGPGRFEGTPDTGVTDSIGEAEVLVSSTTTEQGTQTIVVSLDDDADDTTPLTQTADEQQDECDRLGGDPAASGQSPAAPAGACADEVTKTWSQAPIAQCADGIDNDGDGMIDFPADPGCVSAADDSELDLADGCTGEGVIAGTDGADVLTGTAGDDLICGFGGNDTLHGLGGDDVLLGGGGDDELNGGGGADIIEADEVAACLQTGCAGGNDTADGGGAKDTIRGHGGSDLLVGGNKNDLMVGGAGNDILRGERGWDTIRGNAGDDRLVGNAGNDILQGGVGNDLARGGAGNDTLRGFTGRDNLRGGRDDDIIKGAGGRDQLRGGRGDDILDGGAARDACFGGPGNDVLRRCE